MHNTLLTALAGLAIAGALLVAGAVPGTGVQSARMPASVTAEPGEATARMVPGEAASQPRKRARVRASLSMPYFSFAQSLRAGG